MEKGLLVEPISLHRYRKSLRRIYNDDDVGSGGCGDGGGETSGVFEVVFHVKYR